MSERKFSRGLAKPGMAAQLRETVSQVVRESTAQTKLHMVEPLDFESYILKNKTILQNDPQRELLLYPSDDISQVLLPRKYRTLSSTTPAFNELKECSLFTNECIKTYTSNWNLIYYKYSAYSGSYLELPKILKSDELKDEIYEVDTDADQVDEDINRTSDGVTKQGYLLKGPDVDRMFPNIGSKSFKKRYCYLRREVDGTYMLELHKDEKKGEAKVTIVMDFCNEVVKNSKRGKFCFELHMTAGHKSFILAAENEQDLNDWISKLQLVLQTNRLQEEKRAGSLERTSSISSLPLTPGAENAALNIYGTLRGLEQSVNPQLMKYARETDTSIALARRDNRRRIYSVYPFMAHTKQMSSSESAEPYREYFGQRLLIKCTNLRFKLQAPLTTDRDLLVQIEPYMLIISLFDAKNMKKLTEDFHWEVSCDAVTGMIMAPDGLSAPIITDVDLPDKFLENPAQAVFSISNPHSDVFLVARIEKILQGSIAQAVEPYTRTTKDPKLGLKVHKTVQAAAQRLGKYRMPFAWAARPLFRLYSNEPDTASDFPALYKQESSKLKDEELLKILSDYRKPDKLNKLTVVPGWLQIKIEPLSDLPQSRYKMYKCIEIKTPQLKRCKSCCFKNGIKREYYYQYAGEEVKKSDSKQVEIEKDYILERIKPLVYYCCGEVSDEQLKQYANFFIPLDSKDSDFEHFVLDGSEQETYYTLKNLESRRSFLCREQLEPVCNKNYETIEREVKEIGSKKIGMDVENDWVILFNDLNIENGEILETGLDEVGNIESDSDFKSNLGTELSEYDEDYEDEIDDFYQKAVTLVFSGNIEVCKEFSLGSPISEAAKNKLRRERNFDSEMKFTSFNKEGSKSARQSTIRDLALQASTDFSKLLEDSGDEFYQSLDDIYLNF